MSFSCIRLSAVMVQFILGHCSVSASNEVGGIIVSIPVDSPNRVMALPTRRFRSSCCSKYRTSASHLGQVPKQSPWYWHSEVMNSISFASAICRRISFKILQVCFPLAMALIIRGFIGESVELGDSHFFQKFYALVNILLRIIGRDEWCPDNDLLGFVFPD